MLTVGMTWHVMVHCSMEMSQYVLWSIELANVNHMTFNVISSPSTLIKKKAPHLGTVNVTDTGSNGNDDVYKKDQHYATFYTYIYLWNMETCTSSSRGGDIT